MFPVRPLALPKTRSSGLGVFFIGLVFFSTCAAAGEEPPAVPAVVPLPTCTDMSDLEWHLQYRQIWFAAMPPRLLPKTKTIPPALRTSKLAPKDLIEAIGKTLKLQVVWYHEGRFAVLVAGASDEDFKKWQASLQSTDVPTRRKAIWQARWISDVRVIPLLLEVLKDPTLADLTSETLYQMGPRAVGAVGGDAALPFLESLLASANQDRAEAGAFGLGFVGSQGALTVVEREGKGKNKLLIQDSILVAGQIGGENALRLLNTASSHPEASVRAYVAYALGTLVGDGATPCLCDLLKDLDPDVRYAAAYNLALNPSKQAREAASAALTNPDPMIRDGIIRGLGARHATAALPELKKALTDADVNVRATALAAISRLDGAHALDLLDAALKDNNARIRQSAINSLSKMSSDGAVDRLGLEFKDPDPIIRRRVASALGNIGGERATRILLEGMKDSVTGVLLAIIEALGMTQNPVAVDSLYWLLSNREHGFERMVAAATALGRLGGDKVVVILARAFADPNPQVWQAVSDALVEIGGDDVAFLVGKYLDSANIPTQIKAIRTLGKIGGEQAFALVSPFTADPDPSIRGVACMVVASFGGDQASTLLRKVLADRDPKLRGLDVIALGLMRDKQSRDTLEAKLADPDVSIRSAACYGLGRDGSGRALELLNKAQEDKDEGVRAAVVTALLGLRPEMVRSLLDTALADKSPRVRVAAISTAIDLLREDALPAVKQALTDPDIQVRCAAATALGRQGNLGSEAAVGLLEAALADVDRNVRLSVVEALGVARGTKACDILLHALETEKDGKVRDKIVAALDTYFPDDPNVRKIIDPLKPKMAPALVGLSAKSIRDLVRMFIVIRFYQDLVKEEKDSDFMVSNVAQPFMNLFCTHALSLKEFGGDKEEADITWTPLEKQMLAMLRTAVISNPYFTMTSVNEGLRGVALTGRWAPEKSIRLALPEKLEAALAAMDVTVYKQTALDFRKWELDQCAQQPAWKLQRQDELNRLAWLLGNILNHARYQNLSVPKLNAWTRADREIEKTLQSKWKELNEEHIPENLFNADSLTGKFWAYYQQALKTNPCFADPKARLDEGSFMRMYMEYTKKGDAVGEQEALDQLMKLIWTDIKDETPAGK